MLARCIKFNLPNGDNFETPLLLPSFSSKGFPDLKKMIRVLEEYIAGPVLISAYDVNYKLIQKKIRFSSQLLFIDSGGYECSSLVDFVNQNIGIYKPKKWNEKLFYKTINMLLEDDVLKVIISYDHPRTRQSLSTQLSSTYELFKRLGAKRDFVKEILLKPESKCKDEQLLPIDKIIKNINKFEPFDIIGVTEKELGLTQIAAMLNMSASRMS